MGRKKVVVWSIVCVVVLTGAWGVKSLLKKFQPMFSGPPPVVISAAKAEIEEWSSFLPAIGSLSSVHSVIIAPEVNGKITQIYFNSGQTVTAGAPLIQLNDEEEQANFKKLESQTNLAKITFDRSVQLTAKKAESEAEKDRKQASLSEAEAMMAQAKAIIDKKLIKAPFDGELGIRQVNFGQYVQPGTPIVTLTDLSEVHVNVTRPEQDRALLQVGQDVLVKVDAHPGKEFQAKITSIDPQIKNNSRAIQIQATMKNSENLLYPGMYADVNIILPNKNKIVTVPETAVDFGLYGSSVFIVKEEGLNEEGKPILTVSRIYVETGERRHGKVSILKGLEPDAVVVSSGQIKLNNGSKVIINNDVPLVSPSAVGNS